MSSSCANTKTVLEKSDTGKHEDSTGEISRLSETLLKNVTSMERASFGDVTLWRNSIRSVAPRITPCGLVSTVLFRFAGAYRGMSKYARGLSLLSTAVGTLLPGFVLRVYCDASVDPRTLRSAGLRGDADAVEAALGTIAASGGEVVWFRCASAVDGLGGHRDLFGTLLRFLPLFNGETLPAWAGGPPDGTVVLVTDADFSDFSVERAMLLVGAWLVKTGSDSAPELVALTTGASAALRHAPSAGMPPFIANCVATRARFPLAWLVDFLRDAASPGVGSLAGRHAADIHDVRARNFTYEKRKIATQTSRYPFGVDEFFLSSVLKARTISRNHASKWFFLVVPSLDILVRKALGLLAAGAERAARAGGGLGERTRLAVAVAALAGVPIAGGAVDDSTLLRSAGGAWSKEFPSAASARAGGWERAAGSLRFCNLGAMAAPARDVREVWIALTDALAAGAVPSEGAEDLEYALQGAATAAAVAPHLVGVVAFSVGCGAAVSLGSSIPAAVNLLAYLGDFRAEPLRAIPQSFSDTAEVLLNDAAYQEARGATITLSCVPAAMTTATTNTSTAAAAAASISVTAESVRKRARADEPPPLPEGWTLLESKSTGRTYFFHSASNISSWERPKA